MDEATPHLHYLREHKRLVYLNLLTSGRLNEYLASVNEQAKDMFFQQVKEYAERQGVTEQLKAENQIEWVGRQLGELKNFMLSCIIEEKNQIER